MLRVGLAVVLLVGCGSDDKGPSDGGGSGSGSDGQIDTPGGQGSTTYLYLPGDMGVTGYIVDAAGALTKIDQEPGGTIVDPAPTGGNSMSIAMHPNKKFLYTSNYTDSTISAFSIDAATGLLTKIDGDSGTPGTQDFPGGGNSTAWVAMDPMGRVLYASQYASGTVVTFSIDSSTGVLTSLGSISVTSAPRGMAVDPQARTLAITGYTNPGKVTMCTLDSTTGVPTAIDADGATGGRQDFAADTSPAFAMMDHTGTHLYVSANVGNKVDAYTINPSTAVITPLTTVDSIGPLGILFSPDDKYMYVAGSSGAGSIDDFAVATDGTPTALASTTYSQPQPRAFGIDPTNHFVYASDDNNQMIFRYAFDSSTGALSAKTMFDGENAGGYNMVIVAK